MQRPSSRLPLSSFRGVRMDARRFRRTQGRWSREDIARSGNCGLSCPDERSIRHPILTANVDLAGSGGAQANHATARKSQKTHARRIWIIQTSFRFHPQHRRCSPHRARPSMASAILGCKCFQLECSRSSLQLLHTQQLLFKPQPNSRAVGSVRY